MEILTIPAAAERYEIPAPTIYSAVREGRLEAQKMGGTWLIEREILEQFVKQWKPRGKANDN